MKDWNDIHIDLLSLGDAIDSAKLHKLYNPGCDVKEPWITKAIQKGQKLISERKTIGHIFVGHGWPKYQNQTRIIEKYDKLGLANVFPHIDCRDAGEAIYVGNLLIPLLSEKKNKIKIVEFGVGYGRFAIPFLHFFRDRIIYIGIDYVPLSLVISSQFLEQFLEVKCRKWYDTKKIENFDFVSLPTWRIDELNDYEIDLFINAYSFQEMLFQVVDFYSKFSSEHIVKDNYSYFYYLGYGIKYDFTEPWWEEILNEVFMTDYRVKTKLWRLGKDARETHLS